jgi:hypothetical protein
MMPGGSGGVDRYGRCRMRPRATLSALLLVAAVAAGCGSGGEDRGDYVQALNRAQTGLAQRFGALQARITPTSSAGQDARTLLAYEAAVRRTVAGLRAVDPPAGFAGLHRRFVGEVAGYGGALRTARAELRGEDPQAILAAQGRLRAAVSRMGTKLDATVRAINRKLKD